MISALPTVAQARDEYEMLGFDTVPLWPGTKDPFIKGWPTLTPAVLWHDAPAGANIGLRGGGEARAAWVDCDAPETFVHAEQWLDGLGFASGDYPVDVTASGEGRRIYLTLTQTLPGHSRKFTADFGAGEFKYGPASQIVAPPSVVHDRRYERIAGDLRQLPRVTVADVLPLLKNKGMASAPLAPVVTDPAKSTVPRLAWRILSGDAETIGRYQTRSEAEQAAIASLINGGNSFDDVLRLFVSHPAAGKFAEMCKHNRKQANAWLWRSYEDAQKWATTHESEGRRTANAAIAWAEAAAWPGRGGATDRAVFVAHATIACRAGRTEYAADCRTLAELAGVGSFKTASRATRRLITSGLLRLEREHTVTLSNVYRLTVQTDTLPNPPSVRKCVSLSKHDAFRGHWLGQPGAELWATLDTGEVLTVKELTQRTGRDKRTVAHKLERMETLDMVKCEGDAWRVCPVDLERVARLLHTAGAGERQKARHAADRRNHRDTLRHGRSL